MDRSAISRAVAKAIAYNLCGKYDKACQWAAWALHLMDVDAIVSPEFRRRSAPDE